MSQTVVDSSHVLQGMATADAQLIIDTFRAILLEQTPTSDLLDNAYRLAVTNEQYLTCYM